MRVVFQVRHDWAIMWAAKNPLLREGEPGLEIDTRRVKYGDGVTHWNLLEYSPAVIIPEVDDEDSPSLELLYQNAKV